MTEIKYKPYNNSYTIYLNGKFYETLDGYDTDDMKELKEIKKQWTD